MRRRLWRLRGRRSGVCPACAAPLDAAAVWCGSCGAAATAGPQDEGDGLAVADIEQDGPHDAAATTGGRRSLAAVVALALVAAAAVVGSREQVGTTVLGDVDVPAGTSSSGQPPRGLRLAWAQTRDVVPDTAFLEGLSGLGGIPVVAGDGLVRVGDRVVRQEDGALVAVGSDGLRRFGAHVRDGMLRVTDSLTGEVRPGAPVSDEVRALGVAGPAGLRVGDRSVFTVQGASGPASASTIVVDDDGGLVGTMDGRLSFFEDRVVGAASAFVVRPDRRSGPGAPDVEADPVRVVDLRSGQVVLEVEDSEGLVVDVVDGLVAVADTEDRIGRPGTGIDWQVRLFDAAQGVLVTQVVLRSSEPPRLLGRLGPDPVVATASGRSVEVVALPLRGPDSVVAAVTVRRTFNGSGGGTSESTTLRTTAVVDDLLVLAEEDDSVVAVDRDGREVWRRAARDVVAVAASDGVVAVVVGNDRDVRLLSASDGTPLGSPLSSALAGGGERRGRPAPAVAAAFGGHVGIAPSASLRGSGGSPVGGWSWFDVVRGDPAPLAEVFSPYVVDLGADGVDLGASSWELHGTTTDDAGRRVPIVTRAPSPEVLEVLEVGVDFRTVELGDPDAPRRDVFARFSRVIGADADRVVVAREGVAEQVPEPNGAASPTGTVLVVDTTGWELTEIPGVLGFDYGAGTVLAVVVDPRGRPAAIAALDPATGVERWRRPVDGDAFWFASSVFADDLLLRSDGLGVTAVELVDGTERWEQLAERQLVGVPVVTSRHVVLRTVGDEVVAFGRGDGAVAWRSAVGGPTSAITVAGDHVVLGTHDGQVVHLDARGEQVQRIAVGTVPVTSVAVLGDTVVAVVGDEVVGLRADGTGITRRDEVELP